MKYQLINKTVLMEINGNLYIEENETPLLFTPQYIVPIYFAKTETARIHHDSPVIGAYELGLWLKNLSDPFLKKEDAEKEIENQSQALDHANFAFKGSVLVKPYPVSKKQDPRLFSPRFFRYYHEHTVISDCNADKLIRRYGTRVLDYHHPTTKDQVLEFSDLIFKRVKERAREYHQSGNTTKALFDGNGNALYHFTLFDDQRTVFEIRSFSDKIQNINFQPDFEELKIDFSCMHRSYPLPVISIIDPVQFKLSYSSIEDLLQSNDSHLVY